MTTAINYKMSTKRWIGVLVLGGAAATLFALATADPAEAAPRDTNVAVNPVGPVNPDFVHGFDVTPGLRSGLNPQPLPPGPDPSPDVRIAAPWLRSELNPQPLPPGPDPSPDVRIAAPWLQSALNPQPLPPGLERGPQDLMFTRF
jgi:hypothetical protein